jgi:hypothetical protein
MISVTGDVFTSHHEPLNLHVAVDKIRLFAEVSAGFPGVERLAGGGRY